MKTNGPPLRSYVNTMVPTHSRHSIICCSGNKECFFPQCEEIEVVNLLCFPCPLIKPLPWRTSSRRTSSTNHVMAFSTWQPEMGSDAKIFQSKFSLHNTELLFLSWGWSKCSHHKCLEFSCRANMFWTTFLLEVGPSGEVENLLECKQSLGPTIESVSLVWETQLPEHSLS